MASGHGLANTKNQKQVRDKYNQHTMWLTPTMGFLNAAASDFAAFIPTLRQPGIPG